MLFTPDGRRVYSRREAERQVHLEAIAGRYWRLKPASHPAMREQGYVLERDPGRRPYKPGHGWSA